MARCPMLAALKSHWSSLERSWVVSLAVGRVVHLRWVVFSRLLPLLLPPLPPHRRCVPSLFDGSLCLRPDLYVTHTHKEERGLAASRRTRNMKQNYRYCISRSLPPPPSFPPSLPPFLPTPSALQDSIMENLVNPRNRVQEKSRDWRGTHVKVVDLAYEMALGTPVGLTLTLTFHHFQNAATASFSHPIHLNKLEESDQDLFYPTCTFPSTLIFGNYF